MTTSGRCADFALLPGVHAGTSGFNTPAWLVYALIPADVSRDPEIHMGAVEITILCDFASSQRVFQTLQHKCNFLFKVTEPSFLLFCTHLPPLPLPLTYWVQSRTILSTHKVRLLIFAYWPLDSAAFQESELWEMLSPTQNSSKLG